MYVSESGHNLSHGLNIDTSVYPGCRGLTYELCSGAVDKDIPLAETAACYIYEECGYRVSADAFELIGTFRLVAKTSLFMCSGYISAPQAVPVLLPNRSHSIVSKDNLVAFGCESSLILHFIKKNVVIKL